MSEHEQNSPEAQVELLGLIAQASLVAFEQTAAAASMASAVDEKLLLGRIASQRFSHLEGIERELAARGASLASATAPFTAPVEAFAGHTTAHCLGEALVRLCVLGGLVHDFADGIRGQLPAELQALLDGSIDDAELSDEPGRMLAAFMAAQPAETGALAMYARRLLGEAFSQAQRVAAARPALTSLVTGRGEGDDLAAIGDLMARLASAHAERLTQLGLA